jgi:hypothetical protein
LHVNIFVTIYLPRENNSHRGGSLQPAETEGVAHSPGREHQREKERERERERTRGEKSEKKREPIENAGTARRKKNRAACTPRRAETDDKQEHLYP